MTSARLLSPPPFDTRMKEGVQNAQPIQAWTAGRCDSPTAHEMRVNQTNTEKLLWSKLRRENIKARFRRQHPLYGFIVDSCCVEHRLVIELDGDSHAETVEYDAWRTEKMKEAAIECFAFLTTKFRTISTE